VVIPCCIYPPATPTQDQRRQKLNSFIELLPTEERTVLRFVTVPAIKASNKTNLCILHSLISVYAASRMKTSTVAVALSFQFRIKLSPVIKKKHITVMKCHAAIIKGVKSFIS